MKKNLLSKALTLCLAVVLCLGMLAGCGGKQLTPKELFDLTVNNEEKEINDGVITMPWRCRKAAPRHRDPGSGEL